MERAIRHCREIAYPSPHSGEPDGELAVKLRADVARFFPKLTDAERERVDAVIRRETRT